MSAIIATLVVVLVGLALDAGAVRTEAGADLLTPTPRSTVQTFVTSLAANRPSQARERLTARARDALSVDAVADLSRSWRSEHGDFRLGDGLVERAGGRAIYHATLQTEQGGVERTFELRRNAATRLWRIERIDP